MQTAQFPTQFVPYDLGNSMYGMWMPKSFVQSSGKLYMHFINEQSKSIVTGPFYVHVCTEFEAIWMLLLEDVAIWNPMRYQTLYHQDHA